MKRSRLTKEEQNKVMKCIEIFYAGNKSGPEVCKEHGILYGAFNYYKNKLELEGKKDIPQLKPLKEKKEKKLSKTDQINCDVFDEELVKAGLKPKIEKSKEINYLDELNKILLN